MYLITKSEPLFPIAVEINTMSSRTVLSSLPAAYFRVCPLV